MTEKRKKSYKEYSKSYYEKNKINILDKKMEERLVTKYFKPYNLKSKGSLYSQDTHLIHPRRKNKVDLLINKNYNFNEIYKMIFKRDLKWKE